MKKKFFPVLLCAAAVMLGASLLDSVSLPASAYYVNTEDFRDDFTGNSIDEDWVTSADAALVFDHSSLKLVPEAYEWGGHVLLTAYRVEKTVTITYDFEEIENGGWFAFSFGSPIETSPFYDSQAAFVFTDEETQYFNHTDSDIEHDTGISFPFTPLTGVSGTRRTIQVRLERQTDSTYIASLAIYEKNGSPVGTMEDIALPCVDGYVGFNSEYCSAEIYSVRIENAEGGTEYYDDFSDSSCRYTTGGSSSAEWNSVSFSEDELSVGHKNRLSLPNIGSYATYAYPYQKNTTVELDRVYSLKSVISLTGQDTGTDIGFEIARPDSASAGYFLGVRRNASGYSVVTYADGNENETCQKADAQNAGPEVTLQADVYQDGSVTFSAGGLEITIDAGNPEGYFGLAVRNHSGNSGNHGGAVLSFTLDRASYRERNSEDMSINFNGTKADVEEDETYYDFYYNRNLWYTGECIKQSVYREGHTDGYLAFSGCSPYSAFGPRRKFSEAIVRFDVEITSSSASAGACLGLQFGKKTVGTIFQNCPSLGIAAYPQALDPGRIGATVYRTNCDYVSGYENVITDSDGEQMEFFRSGAKYTFLYIIRDNRVSMSFRSSDEEESVLMQPRTVVELSDTDGFMAVYGANGLSFTLDNVSFTNLDFDAPTGTTSSLNGIQGATRYDFAKDTDLSGIALSDSEQKNGKLRMAENGSLSTSGTISSHLLRFGVSNIENTLRVSDGGSLVVDLVSSDSDYVRIEDASHTYRLDLGSDFLYSGSVFEIMRFGSQLTIAYSSGDKSVAQMSRTVRRFDINPVYAYDTLSLTSVGGITSLNSYSVFNLDSHVEIATVNYDPETDDVDPWPYRPESSGGGCNGNIASTSLLLSVLALMGTIILLGKGKEESDQ